MNWRHLTTRDPLLLKSAEHGAKWLSPAMKLDARVVAILGVEENAAIVVKLSAPSVIGFDENTGLHLVLADTGAVWGETGVVEARRFQFPPDSPALHKGVASDFIEGRLTYELYPFDLEDVFAQAEEGGGSRLLNGAELAQLVEYARTRNAAVTNVETYELREGWQIPRIDLGIYGLDGKDEDLTDAQRIDLAAGYVSEVLALADEEGRCFGYQAWIWSNADR
jgi:hypothetical protein